MNKNETTLSYHVDYDGQHQTEMRKFPSGLPMKLYVGLAHGMLFESAWTLDANDDWSVWLNGVCIEASGDHLDLMESEVSEESVDWGE
jgi:hypothetical protein